MGHMIRNALDSRLNSFARSMRSNPTEPEKRLWRRLSASQLGGFKFRRQAQIGSSIVDFYCPAINLAIEVDGDTHDAGRDRTRDAALAMHGVHILRVRNDEVMRNIDGVLDHILAKALNMPPREGWRRPEAAVRTGPTPTPPQEGRGLAGTHTPAPPQAERG